MTLRKHLKQLVRARMEKTGESYVTARRHVLKTESPAAAAQASRFTHYPGNVPIATALRIVLAHAGLRAPHTGEPFSEAMTFGIGGGIGAGVCAFHYAKENWSSFYVAGRHLWPDDVAWMKGACERFSVEPVVRETSSATAAEKALKESLAGGPVVAWVDLATLPYSGLPAWMSGGGYHVLAVYELKEKSVLVGDRADAPLEIPRQALQAARARIRKQKNRLVSVSKGKRSLDFTSAVRGGLKACAEGLTKGRLRNFTLGSFRDWADRMHGHKGRDSWEAMFPPGPNLRRGLCSINEFIEHWGTGGGLMRPLMSEFLAEAGEALGDARFRPVADRYAELGREWSALAEAALSEEIPALREARELVQRKSELFLGGGPEGDAERRSVTGRLEPLGLDAKPFPVSARESDDLRRRLKERIVKLCDGEEAALKELARLAD